MKEEEETNFHYVYQVVNYVTIFIGTFLYDEY